MWFGRALGCPVNILLDFLINLFVAAPTTNIVLVIVDRYLHIKHLFDYAVVFTPKRYQRSLVLVFVVTVLKGCSGTVASIHSKGNGTKGKVLIVAVGFVFIFISCVVYLVSYFHLRKLERRGASLSSSTKKITKIAKLYLILKTVFKALVTSLAAEFVNKNTTMEIHMGLVNLSCNLVLSMYTVLNAVIFVYVNRAARTYFVRCVFMGSEKNRQSNIQSGKFVAKEQKNRAIRSTEESFVKSNCTPYPELPLYRESVEDKSDDE